MNLAVGDEVERDADLSLYRWIVRAAFTDDKGHERLVIELADNPGECALVSANRYRKIVKKFEVGKKYLLNTGYGLVHPGYTLRIVHIEDDIVFGVKTTKYGAAAMWTQQSARQDWTEVE